MIMTKLSFFGETSLKVICRSGSELTFYTNTNAAALLFRAQKETRGQQGSKEKE